MVARKVLKREVLIGHEAVANRTMLDLHRPLERGLLKEGSEKDVEAVRELLKHLLRLVSVNGAIDAANVRAVVGVPAARGLTNSPPQCRRHRGQPAHRHRAVRRGLRPDAAAHSSSTSAQARPTSA
jgi:rod shape-determining protein MreB